MSNIKIIKVSSEKQMEDCFHIRTVVFIHEQNVPVQEEIDGLDKQADHYLLSADEKPVATARVRIQDGMAKIERVAVLKNQRGLNIGRRLMEFIMADILKNSDIKILKLGAQIQAIVFYEKLGFESYGEEYFDANIRHNWMKKEL